MKDFFLGNQELNFYGFIVQRRSLPSEFTLAIRGTDTWIEWWDDADIFSVPFTSDPDAGRVTDGFNRIYETLTVVQKPDAFEPALTSPQPMQGTFAEQVAQAVQKRTARLVGAKAADMPQSMAVTGHSLGAALCTLYVAQNAYEKKLNVTALCTFASPRVGNQAFSDHFRALDVTSWRIVNEPDIAPNLPPDIFGFVHVDTVYAFNSTGIAKSSLGCAHAMNTYLSLLDSDWQLDPGCAPAGQDREMLSVLARS
jgi:predicted lipase